jgi:hypothetical protein
VLATLTYLGGDLDGQLVGVVTGVLEPLVFLKLMITAAGAP